MSRSMPVLGLLLTCIAWGADPPVRQIEYRDDRLTVRVTQISLTEVLNEVAHQASAEVVGGVKEERPISVDFANLPLDEGLARLLGKQNFLLVYGRSGLRAVELLGGPQPPPKPTSAPASPASPGQQNVFQMFQTRPPLPINGRLGAALGSDKATYPQLLDSAMHNEDVAVRTDALRVWLQGLEQDAELRGAFVSSINAADEQQLTSALRGMAGIHAEELVQHVMAQAQGSELRVKASSLLQQLRKVPAPGA